MDESRFVDSMSDQYLDEEAGSVRPQSPRKAKPDKAFCDVWASESVEGEMPELRGRGAPVAFADLADKMKYVRREKKPTSSATDKLSDLRVLSGLELSEREKGYRRDQYAQEAQARKEHQSGMESLEASALAANWAKGHNTGLRKQWSQMYKDGELHASGLPLFLQKVVEGTSDNFEQEVQAYLKVAGLSYVMTEERLNNAVEEIADLCDDFGRQVSAKINSLIADYRKMQYLDY